MSRLVPCFVCFLSSLICHSSHLTYHGVLYVLLYSIRSVSCTYAPLFRAQLKRNAILEGRLQRILVKL